MIGLWVILIYKLLRIFGKVNDKLVPFSVKFSQSSLSSVSCSVPLSDVAEIRLQTSKRHPKLTITNPETHVISLRYSSPMVQLKVK